MHGALDLVEDAGAATRVVGWVRADEAVTVQLVTGGRAESVVAAVDRFDVRAGAGQAARGFDVLMDGVVGQRLCLVLDGVEVDCQELGCRTLFGSAFRSQLEREFGDQRAVAHVIDTRTGCQYGLRPDLAITAASVIKIQVLAAVLRQAEVEGRDLDGDELRLVEAMMHFSLNPETATLIGRTGGPAGLERLDDRFGADATTHVVPFGATVSTARDRTLVALQTLHGGGPLTGAGVDRAWEVMRGVHPAQSWGISAGLPAGYDVALKNGFFPLTGSGWRVGSSGFVADPNGGGYAVTIMTDRNVTQADGLELVEVVARHVNGRLTVGPPAPRPFDEVDCVLHEGGESWAELTERLGLPAGRAGDVRRVAGGDGPMRGQLVCAP